VTLSALALLAGVLGAAGYLVARQVRRSLMVVRVDGISMLPTLRDGDLLLARRCAGDALATGDIVVCRWPEFAGQLVLDGDGVPITSRPALPTRIVKRVAATPGEPLPAVVRPLLPHVPTVPAGTLVVLSDHDGYDSRTFGLLPFDLVLAVAVRPMIVD
jgi:signal peptidase I